jgi:predicted ATPase
MIKSVTFKEHYELSLEKEEQKRWGTKTYQPTRYTREKKPWTMFFLFKKGLTIEFNKGVNIIVGENGSGKSTLFSLIKSYAGTAPDRMSRALSDCKTDEDFIESHRKHYNGCLTVDGDISFKNTVFFDAEEDNPVVGIPKMITPSNMPTMAAMLWDAQEESHGESMKPILEYILLNAKNCSIFMDEPDTALSLSNQVWLGKMMKGSATLNGNQVIASTHALALINQFDTVFDMEARKWVNREKYVNEIMK